MTTAVELMNSKLTLVISVMAIMGVALTFMDSRHASALDVQELAEVIQEDRIDQLEFKIDEAEDRIRRLTLAPDIDSAAWELQELGELESKVERYIRKLKRLEGA